MLILLRGLRFRDFQPIIKEDIMIKNIHFGDNIFFLGSLIKTLTEGFSLDVDEEYFIEKTVEDLFFIDGTLRRILNALKDNNLLIDRKEYLRNLLKADINYLDLINQIVEGKIAGSFNFGGFKDKFISVTEGIEDDISQISSMLSLNEEVEKSSELVSNEEFKFLLKEDNEDTG